MVLDMVLVLLQMLVLVLVLLLVLVLVLLLVLDMVLVLQMLLLPTSLTTRLQSKRKICLFFSLYIMYNLLLFKTQIYTDLRRFILV
jgi:hypothetical protein